MPRVCRQREWRQRFAEEISLRKEVMREEAREAGLRERERRPLLSRDDGRFMFIIAIGCSAGGGGSGDISLSCF